MQALVKKTLTLGFQQQLVMTKNQSTHPTQVIFFNYGIHLTTEGSEVIEDLKRIEEKGAKIMTCGACLDFYDRKEKLLIGEVTNMYVIYDTLSKADRNVIIR